MTEADWLTGIDFAAHAEFATQRLSPRRQRLLAAGFCRAVSHLFDHPDLDQALLLVEQYADGLVSPAEVEKARQQCRVLTIQANDAHNVAVDGSTDALMHWVRHELAWAVAFAASSPLPVDKVGTQAANAAVQARTGVVLLVPVSSPEFDTATAEQALVMRGIVWDVVGNPFRSVAFAPDWRTDTVVSIARHMYASREFSAMPILADALQDAGCDDEAVLNHCRQEGVHVRGCWVLDGVLGRS